MPSEKNKIKIWLCFLYFHVIQCFLACVVVLTFIYFWVILISSAVFTLQSQILLKTKRVSFVFLLIILQS